MANKNNDRIAQTLDNMHKFRNYKTLGLGERDATFRYGINIPYDTPTNFSAGYTGKAIRDLSDNFLAMKGE